ncbi:MAG: peptidoglycan-binding domain-containing protein [Pseudomonadota bacterium]
MDRLLSKSRRGRTVISSTGIPDHTRDIDVAGDDMLINALNRMTRTSKAYVFLDQGLVRANGLIDILVVQPENPPRPDYYIRGAISQLDSAVGSDRLTGSADVDDSNSSRINTVSGSNGRGVSVVTVDLHLVRYPSRQIVPGASVSNSMVVRDRRFSFGSKGLISLTGLNLSVQINRIESNGQAVRNLIEVSLIELIGRHSGVPYWTCLSLPDTNAKSNSVKERKFTYGSDREQLKTAQTALIKLGYLKGAVTGKRDAKTRAAIASFQADEHVLVNGNLDFDTMRRLEKRSQSAVVTKPKKQTAKPKKPKTGPIKTATQPKPNSSEGPYLSGNNGGTNTRVLLPPDARRSTRTERNDAVYVPLDRFLTKTR